jgi:hypothetical protein
MLAQPVVQSEQADPSEPIPNLRSVRILIYYEEKLGRLCKFGFSRKDASLYVLVYAPKGRYKFGTHGFAQDQRSITFGTAKVGDIATQPPHLSIHESGHVHIRTSADRVGPLQVPPLSDWTGQHAATVNAVSFAGLAPFDRQPKQAGADRDIVFAMGTPEQSSGRLALYINGAEAKFATDCKLQFKLERPTLEAPLHVGVALLNNQPLGPQPGVLVVGGWDPTLLLLPTPSSFLFVNAT